MNVLFFNPKYDPKVLTYQRMSSMPMGLVSIATYLRRNGHNPSIVDRSYCFDSLDSLNKKYVPDIVGVALMSNMTIQDLQSISNYFMSKGIPVVVGGTYASVVPEILLRESVADLITIGEGEQIWLNLADALESKTDLRLVCGVAYYENGDVKYSPPQEFMDLSLIGPCDFSLLPNVSDYFQTCYCYKNMVYLYISKGCTANCLFCYNPYFHHSCRRTRPIEHLLDEVDYLQKNHGLETVYFSDELWGARREERETLFAQMKERGISFYWGCQTRIGILKREDLVEMFENGCRWVLFGVETPPGRLAEIANKRIPFDRVQETLKWCKEIGIISNISFILNLPHETEQDLLDTVAYAQSLNPTLCTIHFFSPIERSALYNQVVSEGLYDPPKTIEEVRRYDFSEHIYSSFSEIPDRDFKVIRACFMIQDLFARLPQTSRRQSITLEAIKSVIINIKRQNPADWFKGVYYTGKYFLSMVGYAFLFPQIRRKYKFRFRFRR